MESEISRRPSPAVSEAEGEPVATVFIDREGNMSVTPNSELIAQLRDLPDAIVGNPVLPLYPASTLSTLSARIAEAEKERDEAVKNADKVCDSYAAENQRLHDRATAAEAREAKLREALRFYAEGIHYNGSRIVEHGKIARRALTPEGGPNG